MTRRQDQAAIGIGVQLVARDLREHPPSGVPRGMSGFAEIQMEIGLAAYWYLAAAGSTYRWGDVYGAE